MRAQSVMPSVAVALAFAAGAWLSPARAADLGDVAGVCAECHDRPTALAAATGGHAAGLACADCHLDRRPGRIGRRHRTVPRCTSHHDVAGHPPHAAGGLPTGNRSCLRCHEAHGSTNLALVRPAVRARRARLAPIDFVRRDGAVPGGFADPAAPGTGVCEVCHRDTEFYRADGRGAPHFTEPCTRCHLHDAGFAPVVAEQNCGICHAPEALRHAKPSLHTAVACGACHAERAPAPGPGHRAVPACADCHADRATHAPVGVPPFACTHCHDAHGTGNTHLVLEAIQTPDGASRPIRFDNLLGRVDGSFASASAPGTGLCEVCHRATRFYRADGAGEPHFAFSCLPCHLHGAGFAPR